MANTSYSIEILNSIRANADTEYQARVPEATKDNIESIGRVFATYDLVYNTFCTALIHKIGLTIIQTEMFTNKLAPFKTGRLLTGQDVEEIFVDSFRMAEGSYDPDGGMGEGGINPFKRRQYQDVAVYYHRMNRQDKYVITLYKDDVIKAFRSEATLSSFITAQFNSLYAGAEFDEFVHMKELFAEAIAKGEFKTYLVPEISDTASDTTNQKACKTFVRTAKKAIADAGYPNTELSPLGREKGFKTSASKSQLAMFVHKDIQPHLDVDLYSQIFGPNYAQLGIPVVEVDNFGADNNGTYALITDKDWFRIYDVKNEMTQLHNPEGLYTNYWLHIWQILSYSKFKTAIRLATKDVTA